MAAVVDLRLIMPRFSTGVTMKYVTVTERECFANGTAKHWYYHQSRLFDLCNCPSFFLSAYASIYRTFLILTSISLSDATICIIPLATPIV